MPFGLLSALVAILYLRMLAYHRHWLFRGYSPSHPTKCPTPLSPYFTTYLFHFHPITRFKSRVHKHMKAAPF